MHSSTSACYFKYNCLRDRVNADLGLRQSLSKNNNESTNVGVSLNLSSSLHIPEFVPSSIAHLQNQMYHAFGHCVEVWRSVPSYLVEVI